MMTVVNDIALPALRSVELHILARNAVPGIPYLDLGRTSRLHPPRLEPIIPLSRPLPNPSFTHLGAADSSTLGTKFSPTRG
jgi:hypothetical protein